MSSSHPQAALGALVLFSLSGLSDLLDGLLARREGAPTAIGRLLDPLVDKIVNLSVLMAFVVQPEVPSWFSIVVMLILSKEISVSAVMGIAASARQPLSPSRWEGGLAILQFCALWSLLLYHAQPVPLLWSTALGLVLLSLYVHLQTAVEYGIRFAKISA